MDNIDLLKYTIGHKTDKGIVLIEKVMTNPTSTQFLEDTFKVSILSSHVLDKDSVDDFHKHLKEYRQEWRIKGKKLYLEPTLLLDAKYEVIQHE